MIVTKALAVPVISRRIWSNGKSQAVDQDRKRPRRTRSDDDVDVGRPREDLLAFLLCHATADAQDDVGPRVLDRLESPELGKDLQKLLQYHVADLEPATPRPLPAVSPAKESTKTRRPRKWATPPKKFTAL